MMNSCDSTVNAQPTVTGKAVAPAQSKGGMTQVSLARLLGVCEPGPSRMSVTLNMSTSSSSATPAVAEAPAAAADLELAGHERSRAKKRKAPEGPRGRAKATRITNEAKNVSKNSRLNDFPEQGLKVSGGTLFCQPCATTLPNIRGSIINHLGTKKHKCKLVVFQKRQQADKELRTELSEYFDNNSDEMLASTTPHSHTRR